MRDREYLFSEDLTVDSSGAVDVSFSVLAKVSALIEPLCLGGSYELVHQLWSQFTLVAGQFKLDVTWLRDEVLVSTLLNPCFTYSSWLFFVVLLLVNPSNGTYLRIVSKFCTWAKTHGYCGVEFEERGSTFEPSFDAGTATNFGVSVCQS